MAPLHATCLTPVGFLTVQPLWAALCPCCSLGTGLAQMCLFESGGVWLAGSKEVEGKHVRAKKGWG